MTIGTKFKVPSPVNAARTKGLSRTPGKMAAADIAVPKVAQIVKIYTDENGESKFGEFKIKMSGSGKSTLST